MPFYQDLSKEQFTALIAKAYKHLESCDLCPRECHVNRLKGEKGFCQSDERFKVNSIFPHHGEEPPISGTQGSGTIFFSGCTLRCIFCQNFQISHEGNGDFFTCEQLAEEMIGLQNKGCHNINLVTPTHFVPQIIHTLSIAIESGLNVPVVYNTSGYESVSTLQLLDGIVDVYLPDIKYASDDFAKELSGSSSYVRHNREALKEMWRQVGPLVTDKDGIAKQGLIIRHLVLPGKKSGTKESMEWLAKELGEEVCVSLMAQYSPLYKASTCEGINRRITQEEYFEAVEAHDRAGLSEGWIQDWQGMDGKFIIDFLKRKRERLV
jgi:putative pyruvate formate lyase activating enzyme